MHIWDNKHTRKGKSLDVMYPTPIRLGSTHQAHEFNDSKRLSVDLDETDGQTELGEHGNRRYNKCGGDTKVIERTRLDYGYGTI